MIAEIVISAAVFLFIGLDIWLAWRKDQRTITQSLQKWSREYPVIPFWFGFLCGHIWGQF